MNHDREEAVRQQEATEAVLRMRDPQGRAERELASRDALISDHLRKIMHLENRVDTEAYRADAAEARAQAAEAEAGRLREAFQDLESTASRVAWFGPITGPHWPPLSTALVKARAALAPQGSEAAEQGDRG